MALLELRQVSKRFGGLQALARVTLAIDEGTIAALIGPNGAGKTTLFNILSGLYRPDGGEILLRDRSLIGLKPERINAAGISRTFQNIRLFSHMTVLDSARADVDLLITVGRSWGPDAIKRLRFLGADGRPLLSKAESLLDRFLS